MSIAFLRLINTIRLRRQVIAGRLISPGTAATANSLVFAVPAFALEFGEVSQISEQRRCVPYLSKTIVSQLAGGESKITTTLYHAGMGNKTKAGTSHAPPAKPVVMGRAKNMAVVLMRGLLSLTDDALIMGGIGGFDE